MYCIYGHLWPENDDQTRAAVDSELGELGVDLGPPTNRPGPSSPTAAAGTPAGCLSPDGDLRMPIGDWRDSRPSTTPDDVLSELERRGNATNLGASPTDVLLTDTSPDERGSYIVLDR